MTPDTSKMNMVANDTLRQTLKLSFYSLPTLFEKNIELLTPDHVADIHDSVEAVMKCGLEDTMADIEPVPIGSKNVQIVESLELVAPCRQRGHDHAALLEILRPLFCGSECPAGCNEFSFKLRPASQKEDDKKNVKKRKLSSTHEQQVTIWNPIKLARTAEVTITSWADSYPPPHCEDSLLSTVSLSSADGTAADVWLLRFQQLCEYRRQYGHCCVSHSFRENPALSQWVKRQRYQYKLKKAGQHSSLTDEREFALEQLGFVWDSHKVAWEEKYNELCQYKAIHGHCNVPSNDLANPSLAIWVKCQRRQYKIYWSGDVRRSTMNPERISKLRGLGFVWNPRKLKNGPN